ncbi:ATP phosphoribosyltransferase [Leuconostoc holzapfelii]|uniref:Multifunctional fusion protein n=1 Tax=Leuconostoc holzapfelii TaxID=434464 RepID=A0ABT2NX97_9LACO|nr:ATP phosphoribosyltransferase [Leuconostoc holzapfelii]MCT8388582.1 ATP phosphoribosyltransferase [Leuconostoc holzapfelii]
MQNKRLAAGSRDEYGTRLVQKQQISQTISATLNAAGFTPIATPLLERENTFEHYPTQAVFHLTDQGRERLVLRPDLTLPIARFLTTGRREPRFTKLYYLGDVLKPTDHLSGAYNQETQAGIELIGDDGLASEIQALDKMLYFAQIFGIADVQVVLSDARFIPTVLSQITMSAAQRQQLQTAIEAKNVTQFIKYQQAISDFPTFLSTWPLAFGTAGEAVMWQAQDLPGVAPIVSGWLTLADYVHTHYPDVAVTVDLTAAPPQGYYTGTIMRGFVPSLGRYLFSGGRYDALLKDSQGTDLPAVGMGLNIESLLADWQRQPAEQRPHEPIVVVLGKGRVEQDARPLLRRAGMDTSPLNHPERKLVFDSEDQKYRFILVKSDDVIKYLDRGIGDIGIVGSDVIAEQPNQHHDVLDLQTGRAKFVVAGLADFDDDGQRKKIATKYPKTAQRYFNARGEDVELIKLAGSVELGPLTGLSDAIVDITQSGRTLAENHLHILADVGPVSTHMLVTNGAFLKFQDEITRMITALTQLLAEGETHADY